MTENRLSLLSCQFHYSKFHVFKKIRLSYETRLIFSGPGDRDSISGRVIPKTQKMVFDACVLAYHSAL